MATMGSLGPGPAFGGGMGMGNMGMPGGSMGGGGGMGGGLGGMGNNLGTWDLGPRLLWTN